MKIFLTGFMGSGKTYVGLRLAKLTNRPFLDLDAFIEEQEGRTIRQVFEQDGQDYFRQVERDLLRHSSIPEDVVLSCGGGTPCFYDNMEYMNASGLSIFLETPVPILVERLIQEMDKRPLLQSKTKNQLTEFVRTKLEERLPYYNKANLIYKQHTGQENVAADLSTYLIDITGH